MNSNDLKESLKTLLAVCCTLLKQLDVSKKVASHTALATRLQNEVVIGIDPCYVCLLRTLLCDDPHGVVFVL